MLRGRVSPEDRQGPSAVITVSKRVSRSETLSIAAMRWASVSGSSAQRTFRVSVSLRVNASRLCVRIASRSKCLRRCKSSIASRVGLRVSAVFASKRVSRNSRILSIVVSFVPCSLPISLPCSMRVSADRLCHDLDLRFILSLLFNDVYKRTTLVLGAAMENQRFPRKRTNVKRQAIMPLSLLGRHENLSQSKP